MSPTGTHMQRLSAFALAALLLSGSMAWGQVRYGQNARPRAVLSAEAQLHIPNRLATPLFQGEQGKQRTEIHYDPATGLVTIKLLVQDKNGYFIPNIRRDNFVVYEDGVRQNTATVEIEHAAVSLGLLLEYGGRYPGLNRDLVLEVSRAGHQLLDILGREDRIAAWAYGDTVKQLADFSQSKETLDRTISSLKAPEVSETNLYDALIFALDRIRPVIGRKAIILISSGVDTFSKASYESALNAARDGDTPIYIINLGPVLRELAELHGTAGSLARIDWKDVEHKLLEIAKVSGGRLYSPGNTIDLSATYDDIMENLKVRYVITYKSSNRATSIAARTVRVELVDPKDGKPLQIVDASGRPIRANVIVQGTYSPGGKAQPRTQ
jgi:Ca-activated chloride channel family protein